MKKATKKKLMYGLGALAISFIGYKWWQNKNTDYLPYEDIAVQDIADARPVAPITTNGNHAVVNLSANNINPFPRKPPVKVLNPNIVPASPFLRK